MADSQVAMCSSDTASARDIREKMQSRLGLDVTDLERILHHPNGVIDPDRSRLSPSQESIGGTFIVQCHDRPDDLQDNRSLSVRTLKDKCYYLHD